MKGTRSELWWGCIVAAVLLWPRPYFEEIRSPNELVRIYLVRAIVDDHTLSLDEQFARHGAIVDYAKRDEHIYCDKAPGLSLLGVPVYAAMRIFQDAADISNRQINLALRFVLLLLPTLLLGLGLRRYLVSRTSPAYADLVAGTYVLGTPAFAYTASLFSHQLAACAVGGALLCLHAARERRGWIAAAGALCASAAVVEYPAALVGVLLAAYVAATSQRRWRALGLLALGALIPVAVLMSYQHVAFGAFWKTGYHFIDNLEFRQVHEQGLLGVSTPQWEAVVGLTVGARRGLLWLAPWLVVAPLALWRSREPFTLLLCSVAAAYAWLATSYGHWHGGWAVGPRHFVAALPAMALLAGQAWWTLSRGRGAVLAAGVGLMLTAFVVNAAIVATYPGFPSDIDAPLRDVVFAALADLQSSDNLGTAAGLSTRSSMILWIIIMMLMTVTACVRVCGRVARHWAVATWTLGLTLLVMAWIQPVPTAQSLFRSQWMRQKVWQPKNAHLSLDARLTRWESEADQPGIQGAMKARLGAGRAALDAYTLDYLRK